MHHICDHDIRLQEISTDHLANTLYKVIRLAVHMYSMTILN